MRYMEHTYLVSYRVYEQTYDNEGKIWRQHATIVDHKIKACGYDREKNRLIFWTVEYLPGIFGGHTVHKYVCADIPEAQPITIIVQSDDL